jgi:hypothetical protein
MAKELDYLKIKVGQEKINDYVKDSKALNKKVQIEAMTKKDIVAHVAKSAQNMTKDLKLSTKDKQEIIENVAINTAKNINFSSISDENKILDTKQFAKDINQEMKKLQPKLSISKSAIAQVSRLGERIKEAKNTFVKKVQDINPLKKKDGPGR